MIYKIEYEKTLFSHTFIRGKQYSHSPFWNRSRQNFRKRYKEQIYPMDFRAYEYEKRELWIDVLEDDLRALHKAGFVHRDLRRPSNIIGQPFDNVLLTAKGFRLIDVGISALRSQVGERLFDRFIVQELKELEEFSTFVLSR